MDMAADGRAGFQPGGDHRARPRCRPGPATVTPHLQGTATWKQGQWRIAVTSALGGWWEYTVIGDAPRPSHGWLAGTPWTIYPGSEWDEGAGGRWTVPVFWENGEAPEGNGSLTGG